MGLFTDFTKCVKIIDETKEYNNNLDILYIYAESLYKLKDYKKSITYFKEYLDLCVYDNIRAKIYIQLAKLYICLNQYEDSKIMIKNSLQINKTSYAYLYFSYYYFKKKKYIYAYKLLYKSNEINIFNHKIWASLSIILLHLNMKVHIIFEKKNGLCQTIENNEYVYTYVVVIKTCVNTFLIYIIFFSICTE